MALGTPLRKANTGQQVLYFLAPKIWTKISHSIRNVKTTASLANTLTKDVLRNKPFKQSRLFS